jgi:nicotinamidase-related amidase
MNQPNLPDGAETVRTLVVVDMQPYYSASKKRETMKAVLNEITHARRNRHPIVVVRFGSINGTIDKMREVDKRVLSKVRKYKCTKHVVKYDVDGSDSVNEVLSDAQRVGQIDLCGVEQSVCVKETAAGLRRCCPEATISVLTHACNDHKGRSSEDQYAIMQELVDCGVQVV